MKGKGIKEDALKNYGMFLKHLESHIIDPKEPIDPKDYLQSDKIIKAIKKIKGGELKGLPNYEHLNWGSFTKTFKAFNKKHPRINSLEKYAKYVIRHKEDFQRKTLKRAYFYIDVIRKEGKGFDSDSDSDGESDSDEGDSRKARNEIDDYLLGFGIKNISTNNIMPKFAKGSEEMKNHMKKLREMRGKGVKKGGAIDLDEDDIENVAHNIVRNLSIQTENNINNRLRTYYDGLNIIDYLKTLIRDNMTRANINNRFDLEDLITTLPNFIPPIPELPEPPEPQGFVISHIGRYKNVVNQNKFKRGQGVKGSKSKTHKGEENYTTKKTDKYYHQMGHLVEGEPYMKGGAVLLPKGHLANKLDLSSYMPRDFNVGLSTTSMMNVPQSRTPRVINAGGIRPPPMLNSSRQRYEGVDDSSRLGAAGNMSYKSLMSL